MGVPFYEYRRPDGTTFEVMQKMSDDPLTHDPETGVPVERVFSPIAIHFKGKGFYNTDYGTKKRNREKASSSSGSSSSSDSSSGSSDSSSSSSSDSSSSSSSSSSSDGAKTSSTPKSSD
jgi:putative FmdB family regulatory protein